MQFTQLTLHGFKSFVEKTVLEIPEGMTGIVGPNGCGKSNLVEALRWVMGENSAKRMRGADMDDVIFGGTATRPSRNLAEVGLTLDNTNRSATAEFNNEEELCITRQIERGEGSEYRVNGRPVRQRDVHLLFADQATGAHSTSLVGQGQIDALIRSKPQDRRQILEEASGTAGLHARRHEAELKLKGAEQNLTRVDDVLQAYDAQLRSLKQQVRQASRYRNLAEHIRRTEAALLHLRWLEGEQNAEATRHALQRAEQRVNELLAIVTQGNTQRTEIAAELPGLRQSEAAAASIVQKLTLTREQIDAEMRRLQAETEACEHRLAQAQSDQQREQSRHADGEAALTRLRDEKTQLETQAATIEAQMPGVAETLQAITAEVVALDMTLTQTMQDVANSEARKTALQQQAETLSSQLGTLAQRREQLDAQRTSVAAEAAARPDLAFASALVEASESELAKRQQQMQVAEQNYQDAEHMQGEARDLWRSVTEKATHLKAEASAIDNLLQHHDEQAEKVIDLITVSPGLENALAVALGEALTAALDEQAPTHWRDLPPVAEARTLPQGVASLADHIQAPHALARSLSHIGLVEDATVGAAAAQDLQPGQIIVSRDGWAWRWDGFTVTPQAKTATAVRLQQRNRLSALQDEITTAEGEAAVSEQALTNAAEIFTARQNEERQAREALKAAFAALNDARQTYATQEKEATAITSKLAALDENLKQVNADLDDVRQRTSAAVDELAQLPDVEAQRATLAEQRAVLAERRNQQAQNQAEHDRLKREQGLIVSRLAAVAHELEAWQVRLANATKQLEALVERIATVQAQLHELQAKPAELESQRAQLLTELSDAEAKRKEAADALIAAEQRLNAVEHQLKQDENAFGESKEERVRAEGAVAAAAEHFNSLRERMQEKLGCGPEELPAIAGYAGRDCSAQSATATAPKDGEVETVFDLEQELGRFVRERDTMGPVNLRAETEAEAMQAEIDKLQKEKDDLTAAIAKLRQGITQLNKEARERLQASFTQVNERFQTLFTRLFNGGKAHLELIDNEDPLNAGLEIFASPPGKKMQILSLLSGGERTLTALALLFAVFQTNPSPICVLDEAEAALDESNIGRFCSLVEDIARETGTRFLIITHQRLTMAKMDRLYGVTMGEKGVSQLVSVDLAGAVALRDGKKLADAAETQATAIENAEAALEDVRAA
jgi:chromosome segregation protein